MNSLSRSCNLFFTRCGKDNSSGGEEGGPRVILDRRTRTMILYVIKVGKRENVRQDLRATPGSV